MKSLLLAAAILRFHYLLQIEHNVDHAYPVWEALRILDHRELFLTGQWTWLPIAHPALTGKFEKYNLFVPEFKRFYINSVRLLGNAYEEKTSFAIPRKGGTLQNPLAHIRQQALAASH